MNVLFKSNLDKKLCPRVSETDLQILHLRSPHHERLVIRGKESFLSPIESLGYMSKTE